jgi:glycine reductase complex component B subunit gamma
MRTAFKKGDKTMSRRYKIIHYVNQLFGGIGGEEKANVGPQIKKGAVGPGKAIQTVLQDKGDVVATIICGDNYFVENKDQSVRELLGLVAPYKPDLLIAGPAFNAGRYGVACGEICKAFQKTLGIPAVTGMYEENPGVDLYKKEVYIVKTSDTALGTAAAIPVMVRMALKVAGKEHIGRPAEEGYYAQGFSRNDTLSKNAAERAVDMLLAKINRQPFQSELGVQHFEHVAPAPAVKNLSSTIVCLVTDGGLIPKGNPDKLLPRSATRFGSYSIEGLNVLAPEDYEAYHVGHDTSAINQDPHRLIPLDVMRELEHEGKLRLYESFITTAGVAASLSNSQKVGKEIADQLKAEGVGAVILTST